MPSVTVRNVPDEVQRAICVRAAQHSLSIEDERSDILESAARPSGGIKLGSLLVEVGRKAKLTDEELASFESVRDKAPARAAGFE